MKLVLYLLKPQRDAHLENAPPGPHLARLRAVNQSRRVCTRKHGRRSRSPQVGRCVVRVEARGEERAAGRGRDKPCGLWIDSDGRSFFGGGGSVPCVLIPRSPLMPMRRGRLGDLVLSSWGGTLLRGDTLLRGHALEGRREGR